MDEADTFADFDCVVRHTCIETVKWLLDHSDEEEFLLDDVIGMAMRLDDYIQGGGTVNIQCDDSLRKTVRGE